MEKGGRLLELADHYGMVKVLPTRIGTGALFPEISMSFVVASCLLGGKISNKHMMERLHFQEFFQGILRYACLLVCVLYRLLR